MFEKYLRGQEEEIYEDYDVLDTVVYYNELYVILTPASEDDNIDGEISIMRQVMGDRSPLLEKVDENDKDDLFAEVYRVFKEKNKDSFDFYD